jgi:hypothetical protein
MTGVVDGQQETLYAAVLDDGRLVEPLLVSHPPRRRLILVVGFPGEMEGQRETRLQYNRRYRHR